MISNGDGSAATKNGFVENAEFGLKVLGASAALTAVMGWPAIGRQYALFGIPADLIPVDAAIRAGILPAVIFLLLFGYLWHVRLVCQRLLASKPNVHFTPLFLFQVIPLAAIALLVRAAGVSSGVFLALWWTLRTLGFVSEPAGLVFWVLISVSFFVCISLYAAARSMTNQEAVREVDDVETVELSLMQSVYFQLMDYIQLGKKFIALYLIYLFVSLIIPNAAYLFTIPAMLVLSAFLALAGTLVGVGMAAWKGAGELGLGNLQASTGFSVVSAFLAVLYYSIDVYPELAKSLGGGRPDVAELWVDKSTAPGLVDWPHVTVEKTHFHLSSVHLLRIGSEVVIVVANPIPPAKWAVLPRSAIATISLRSSP